MGTITPYYYLIVSIFWVQLISVYARTNPLIKLGLQDQNLASLTPAKALGFYFIVHPIHIPGLQPLQGSPCLSKI